MRYISKIEITRTAPVERRIEMSNHLKSEIKSIFRRAKKEMLPFQTILKSVQRRIRFTDYYGKLGEAGRSEIEGYIRANFDIISEEHVDWCSWYDGKFVGLTKNLPYGEGFDNKLVESAHVYKGWKTSGQIKRYN